MTFNINLASDLRHRGTIKRMGRSQTKDELGQYPVEEQTVAMVWCAVIPQTGSLLNGRPAETELARTTHKIVIRWQPNITSDMWVVVYGIRYDILYVLDPYANHVILELFCEVSDDDRGTGYPAAPAAGEGSDSGGGAVPGESQETPPAGGEQGEEPAAD